MSFNTIGKLFKDKVKALLKSLIDYVDKRRK